MKKNLRRIIGILMIILAISCLAYIGYYEYQKKKMRTYIQKYKNR